VQARASQRSRAATCKIAGAQTCRTPKTPQHKPRRAPNTYPDVERWEANPRRGWIK
jgi:hypothetical protein